MLKIDKFDGIYPRLTDEQLPDNAAIKAENCKLTSGGVESYYEAEDIEGEVVLNVFTTPGVNETGASLNTIRRVDKGDVFLVASETLDVISNYLGRDEDRFIYTGDGTPKTARLNSTGTAIESTVRLGLPLPSSKPTTRALEAYYYMVRYIERTASGEAILETFAPHGLRTGNTVTILHIGSNETDEDKWKETEEMERANEDYQFNVTDVPVIVDERFPKQLRYTNLGDVIEKREVHRLAASNAAGSALLGSIKGVDSYKLRYSGENLKWIYNEDGKHSYGDDVADDAAITAARNRLNRALTAQKAAEQERNRNPERDDQAGGGM